MAGDQAKKVTTRQIPYAALVHRADPDFEASKRKEPFYEFTRRKFNENTAVQGPYSDEPNNRD